MKLQKARVQNYKCVEDSGEFTTDQITCMVGKNEAGKSAILEALYKLAPVEPEEADFSELDFPRRFISTYREREEKDPANVLTTTWLLSDDDMRVVEDYFGFQPLTNREVTVSKGYTNERNWTINVDEKRLCDSLLSTAKFSAPEKAPLGGATTISELISKLKSIETKTDKHSIFLKKLSDMFPQGNTISTIATNILAKRIPTMVYFTEYHALPGRVAINDFADRQRRNALEFEDRIFVALLDLANSSPDQIKDIGQSEEFIMELEAIRNRLTDEIFEYWTQNRHLSVDFRFDKARPDDPPPFNSGDVFSTRIENRRHRASVNFDERSTGFIWFFSFLIWFSQVKKHYGHNLLILLDEPGLSLHGKAQFDLLRYMKEKLAPHYQVIYTTHSPFMIDAENPFSVRTVEDVVTTDGGVGEVVHGTKVGQRILSRDKDTILPLQGILGFDIAQTMFMGPNVLVVEGPAEFTYIKWFSRQLLMRNRAGLDLRWAIAPAEGAAKITSFVTLFKGRGLRIAALFDYHEGQKGMVDRLAESGLLDAGYLLKTATYAGQDDTDIEDVLGRSLYIHVVNTCFGLVGSNSLPSTKPANAPLRVVKEVEQHCRTLPPGFPAFDHYKPADYLIQVPDSAVDGLPGIELAFTRFEKLFDDLNTLLSPREGS